MVTLENIGQYTIPFDQFRYKWRFTEPKYNVLPAHHLEQIQPLDQAAATLLVDLTVGSGRFDKWPFSNPEYIYIEKIKIPQGEEAEAIVKKWLYRRGLPFEQQVFASWDNISAAITTWKMIVKYWSDFYYPGSDDLIVVDKSLDWSLLFSHEDEIIFGTDRQRRSEFCENELVGTGSS